MPQFDPSSFPTQLFWLAVTFIALFFILSRRVLPRIGEVLEQRQERIDENLDRAAQLKSETEAAIAAYEKALADSRASAQRVLKETGERMARLAEKRQKDVADRLSDQIRAGEARIVAAKQKALASVRDIAQEVARSAAQKIAGIAADDAKLASAVAGAMQEKG